MFINQVFFRICIQVTMQISNTLYSSICLWLLGQLWYIITIYMQVLLILRMHCNVHHLCYPDRIVYWLNRFWNYHTDPIHNYISIQFSGSNLVTFFLAGFVETLEHLFVPVMLLFFIHILWKIKSRKKIKKASTKNCIFSTVYSINVF